MKAMLAVTNRTGSGSVAVFSQWFLPGSGGGTGHGKTDMLLLSRAGRWQYVPGASAVLDMEIYAYWGGA
jgi:hypothetical protein